MDEATRKRASNSNRGNGVLIVESVRCGAASSSSAGVEGLAVPSSWSKNENAKGMETSGPRLSILMPPPVLTNYY